MGDERRDVAYDEADIAIDEEGPESEAPPPHRRSRRRVLVEWVIVIVVALLVAQLIKTFLLQQFSIPSESMAPTLRTGDRVFVNKLSYRLHDVNRGDVVVFERPARLPDPRTKDLIKRAGINISAGEIEAVLRQHPAVLDAAVVGVPDPIRDESIIAFIIPRAGATPTPADLTAWCGQRLATYKLPERFHLVDTFPRTPVGKIQKHLLRSGGGSAGGPG